MVPWRAPGDDPHKGRRSVVDGVSRVGLLHAQVREDARRSAGVPDRLAVSAERSESSPEASLLNLYMAVTPPIGRRRGLNGRNSRCSMPRSSETGRERGSKDGRERESGEYEMEGASTTARDALAACAGVLA